MNIHKERKQKSVIYVTVAKIVLVAMVGGLLLSACGGPKTYTVGVINLAPLLNDTIEGFKQGMAESGYVEGENITYIYEGPANGIDKLDGIAQGLVAEDVDLILSLTTPATKAVQKATDGTDIPVVFVPVTDPVAAGVVDSLKQPGGNITGITYVSQEGRRLEWLIQVVPTIEQVYIPYNSEDQSAVSALETTRDAATTLGVELITCEARNPEEIAAAVENIPAEVDAIFLLPDSVVNAHTAEFVALQLPTSAANPGDLEPQNALTSYGFEQMSAGKQAARLADQIFKGAKPADLPVEQAEFFSAVNLRAAEAIGLDIPDEILRQASIIIR